MMRPVITVLKFVGTISLGLSTGASITLASVASPALLALPSAISANQAFDTISTTSKKALRVLKIAAVVSLSTAWWFSPRRAAHPYLIWTALAAGLADFPTKFLNGRERKIEQNRRRVDVDSRDLNGEEVQKNVERYQQSMLIQGGIVGMGFAMSVIGIWGDGF